MTKSPKVILCTVGTSLFYPNLSGLKTDQYDNNDAGGMMQADRALLQAGGWFDNPGALNTLLESVQKYFKDREWSLLVRQLVRLPPALRLLGAEINSVEAMIRKNFLSEDREKIVFLMSDTEDGQNTGWILKEYFTGSQSPVRFNSSDILPVEGLQDARPEEFQRRGLTSLVRLLGEELRKWGADYTAINATGGYKAQIAVAVAFGQVTKIPVYYKHERFDQIIPFPKVPFTIDLSLVDDNLRFWAQLSEPDAVFTYEDIANYIDPKSETFDLMLPLLESITEEETAYYCMSPLGLIYWEGYMTRYPETILEPPPAGKRRGCTYRDDHYPVGFKKYVERVYNDHDFITGCHSVPYTGQKGIRRNEFYIRDRKIYGHYVDGNNFGARFEAATTARNQLERKGALNRLNKWL